MLIHLVGHLEAGKTSQEVSYAVTSSNILVTDRCFFLLDVFAIR